MTDQEVFYRKKILEEVEELIESCPETNAYGVYLFMKENIRND